ncbi:MAG: metallophosphoesterase family protein [Spirochaetota bacterium]
MKPSRALSVWASLAVGLLPTAVVLWVLGDSRSFHLFKWSPLYRWVFVALTVLSLLIAAAVVVTTAIQHREPKQQKLCLVGKAIALILAVAIPVGFYVYLTPYAAPADKQPLLTITDQTGDQGFPLPAVLWFTAEASTETVDYGRSPDNLVYSVSDSQPVHSHVFMLEKVTPEDSWYWRIRGTDEVHAFSWSATPDQLRFAVSGDSHVGAGTNSELALERIVGHVSREPEDYDVLFHLGDAVEMGNSDQEYTRYRQLIYPESGSIPIVHLMGNHDSWFGGAQYWKQFFSPDSLPSTSSPSRLYRRYDFGDTVHVLALNLEWGTESYGEKQQQWLESQLAAIDPDDLIIIMSHAFYFASSTEYEGVPWYDNQEMIDQFHELYNESGVDLVFSGHNHQMEHIIADDVDYIIIGAMGGKPDKTPTYITSGSSFLTYDHFGFVDLAIDRQQFSCTFRNEQGTALYEFKRQL